MLLEDSRSTIWMVVTQHEMSLLLIFDFVSGPQLVCGFVIRVLVLLLTVIPFGVSVNLNETYRSSNSSCNSIDDDDDIIVMIIMITMVARHWLLVC